ncbi:hypothetical protein J5893_03520 [bacterium]|nr:hypothetical protein [bacterium]
MLNLLSFRNDPPELQGFDYEVSTQLNLEFNFELIFNFLDTFIQEINDWSTSAIKDIEDLNTDLREW